MMRRLLGTATLLVMAIAAGACGGAKAATAQQIVAASTNKTAKTATARVAEVITTTSTTGQPTVPTVTANGIVDFVDRRVSLDLNLKGLTARAILDGTTIYENIAGLAGQLGGKPWIKIDLNDLGKLAGVTGLGDLTKTSNNDPTAGLNSLLGVGSVRTVGHEKVRDVQTTRYSAVVDLEAAAKQAPAAQQATLRQIAALQGVPTQAVDVWIDDQGRVRRLIENVDLGHAKVPAPGAPLPKSVQVSVEFFDFGTPTKIEVPAADQVTDFGAMLLKLKNHQGSGNATPAAAALESRLITVVPPGYQRQADSIGDAGPSDLEKAVRDDTSPDARQILTRDGFLGGYQRIWTKGQRSVIDYAYQFSSPAGAVDYQHRSVADARTTSGVSEFVVSGIPGANGLRHTAADGTSVVVIFTRGPYIAQVEINGADATPQLVTQLAQQQYARLA